jgi:hypothetical protein
MTFPGMNAAEARNFAEIWLPVWSGNHPERLAAFYAEETFYSDPATPAGVRGRPAVLAYFRRSIPARGHIVEVDGVCSVQLRDGLIYSNRVFFDRSELLRTLAADGSPPR